MGRELGVGSRLEGLSFGAVSAHHIVETAATRLKSPRGFGVVYPGNQTHIFAHNIAVEIGRSESILGYHPTGREDDKVDIGGTGSKTWRC